MAHRMGRKPKHYSQVARITFMLRRLIGGATVGELAEELQVTKRQVHRDLQQLEESGYPLEQEDGRWKLPAGFKGLEITVSPYELMSLHLAQSHLAYLKGTPFVDDLEAIIKKVEAGLPDKTRNHLGEAALCGGSPERFSEPHSPEMASGAAQRSSRFAQDGFWFCLVGPPQLS